jgi:hypothetical protein
LLSNYGSRLFFWDFHYNIPMKSNYTLNKPYQWQKKTKNSTCAEVRMSHIGKGKKKETFKILLGQTRY